MESALHPGLFGLSPRAGWQPLSAVSSMPFTRQCKLVKMINHHQDFLLSMVLRGYWHQYNFRSTLALAHSTHSRSSGSKWIHAQVCERKMLFMRKTTATATEHRSTNRENVFDYFDKNKKWRRETLFWTTCQYLLTPASLSTGHQHRGVDRTAILHYRSTYLIRFELVTRQRSRFSSGQTLCVDCFSFRFNQVSRLAGRKHTRTCSIRRAPHWKEPEWEKWSEHKLKKCIECRPNKRNKFMENNKSKVRPFLRVVRTLETRRA